MTREQLQERLTAYGPPATLATLTTLILLIAFSVAVFIAFLRGQPEGQLVWLSFFVLNSSILALGIYLAVRTARLRAKRLHLLCPDWGKAIVGRAGGLALSTGCCPSWGFSLVDQ